MPSAAVGVDLDAFLAQARAYDNISQTELGEVLKSAHTSQLTHPVPVLRAREIDRWAESKEYQTLLQRQEKGYNGKVANKGEWRNW